MSMDQTKPTLSTWNLPSFLTNRSIMARKTRINSIALKILVDTWCSNGRYVEKGSGFNHLTRKNIRDMWARPMYAKVIRWILSQAFNLGLKIISSDSLFFSTRYKTIIRPRNPAASPVAVLHDQNASRVGTIKNADMTAVNWHEIFLKWKANPTVMKMMGSAKLCPHLGSSLNRKKAGPIQNISHKIPWIRIPLFEVITLSASSLTGPNCMIPLT